MLSRLPRRPFLLAVLACALCPAVPALAQVQVQELFGLPETSANFGAEMDVSPDGTWLVATGGNHDPGEAWVYEHDGTAYQLDTPVPLTGPIGNERSNQVAISCDGTVVAIGGKYFHGAGEVHVYRRTPGAAWTGVPEATLYEYEPGHFGTAVDLSDDGQVLVVGSPSGIGRVSVYRYDTAAQSWESPMVDGHPNPWAFSGDPVLDFGEFLGASVAIDGAGERFIAGAPGHYDADAEQYHGLARVFAWDGSDWFQQAVIEIDDPQPGDRIGDSVAIDGNTAVIGAWDDSELSIESGAAYVIDWDGDAWSTPHKLLPTAAVCLFQCRFASDVDVRGDRILVRSAGQVLPFGTAAASASLYRRGVAGEDPWVFLTRIFRDQPVDEQVGGWRGSAALAGPRAIIGAPGDGLPGMTGAGAVRVYQLEDCLCGEFADDFDGGLDAAWVPFGDGAAATVDGELALTVDAGSGAKRSGVQLDRREVMLCGDFDATVDWRIESWPPGMGAVRGFYFAVHGAHNDVPAEMLVGIGRFRQDVACQQDPLDLERYLAWTGAPPNFNTNSCPDGASDVTSDTSGRLRLQRQGVTITASYHDGADWVQLLTADIDDTAVFLQLEAYEYFAEAFDVRFDDLQITMPPCPPVPGACCFPDGTCDDVAEEAACLPPGVWQGPGTDCDGIACPIEPGACCLPDGTCEQVDLAIDCPSYGTWHGAGSTCAGIECFPDCNGNGVDDAVDISMGTSLDANGNGIPDECQPIGPPGDGNGDSVVNVDDLVTIIQAWGDCIGCGADVNGDGVVDVNDLVLVITGWGGTAPVCGYGTCEPGESCATCPQDCGPCPCGDPMGSTSATYALLFRDCDTYSFARPFLVPDDYVICSLDVAYSNVAVSGQGPPPPPICVRVDLHHDPDGGNPDEPGAAWELLAHHEFEVASSFQGVMRLEFDPPVIVPGNSLVVEIFGVSEGAGAEVFRVSIGHESGGSTYYRQNCTGPFVAEEDHTPWVSLNGGAFDQLATDCQCPFGELPDCNGACFPVAWLGDGVCDDGSRQWNSVAIALDCDLYLDDANDCCTQPCNDSCSDPTSVGPGVHAFNTTGATTDGPTTSCAPVFTRDIWYRYDTASAALVTVDLCGSSFDTKVAVYDGITCNDSEIACNDSFDCNGDGVIDAMDGGDARVSFVTTAGGSYLIRIGGHLGESGPGTMTITETPITDENEPVCYEGYVDDVNGGCFSDPPVFTYVQCGQAIQGTGGYYDTDWFSLTLDEPSEVSMSVTANAAPTLRLLLNSPYCAPSGVVQAHYGTPGERVTLSRCLGPGTWYFSLEVGAFGICGEPYVVEFTCAACDNDACTNAMLLNSGSGTYAFDTTAATPDGPSPPVCSNAGPNQDLWFRWYPSPDVSYQETWGRVTVDLCGSSFDTMLAIYGASCPDAQDLIACSDDFDCDNDGEVADDGYVSRTSFFSTLWSLDIQVGGHLGDTGAGTMVLTFDPAVDEAEDCVESLNDSCVSPQSIACGTVVRGTTGTDANGIMLDEDYYGVTMTEASVISWTVTANLPFEARILSSACVPLAVGSGGPFGPNCGDCNYDLGLPGAGCSDLACQQVVCSMDPYCCATKWDASCAENAMRHCECGPVEFGSPVTVSAVVLPGDYVLAIIPAEGYVCPYSYMASVDCTPAPVQAKGEPVCVDGYIDTTNGGCNSDPPVFTEIQCGDVIDGTAGTYLVGKQTHRDTDWFRFVLTEPATITWSVQADFEARVGIINQNGEMACNDPSWFLAYDVGSSVAVTECLAAGTWYLYVATDEFVGVPCGSAYTASLNCGPACDNDECAEPIWVVPGEHAFSTAGASTDGAPNTCTQSGFQESDIWYRYTPVAAARVSIDVQADGFPPFVTVWNGVCPLGSDSYIACGQISLEFDVFAFNTFEIRIGGDDVSEYSGTMTITEDRGVPEGEAACDDYVDVNGGCETVPPPMTIACGTTVVGTQGSPDGDDADFYHVDLTSASTISWTVTAPFDFDLTIQQAVIGTSCITRASDTGVGGETVTVTYTGTPDDYFVSVEAIDSAYCDWSYIATVDCTPVTPLEGSSAPAGGRPAPARPRNVGAALPDLLDAWGDCPGCAADLTGDGLVNEADVAALLSGEPVYDARPWPHSRTRPPANRTGPRASP